ncbi:MAG: Nif3-like dinuclear metal center hexameric protein [Oscillospiraceae bacterium]|jgi:dinuclear metal center YbgI/SA1388 family protein|nr:Nif3-like dinuclear metal center hexameric protein [Oscillospiraceae bacterium]
MRTDNSAATVREALRVLERLAPPEMKMDFDNVGLLAGFPDARVSRILVSLDITDDVIDEAASLGAELIVSHHPLFFSLNRVTAEPGHGGRVVKLIAGGMSAICMHTNLDAARGGVNDALAAAVGLTEVQPLTEHGRTSGGEPFSYGRHGRLRQPVDMPRYLELVKERLGASGLRYHDAGRPVDAVAVVGGAGGGELRAAAACGCDTFITADIKYDVFLEARELGINLIDGDHFCTENTVTPILAGALRDAFPGVVTSVSQRHGQTARFI